MSIRTAILKATFKSRILYNLLNKVMVNKASKQQEEEKEPMVDIENVIKATEDRE